MSYADEYHRQRQASSRSEADSLPLFVVPVRELARRSDPHTSKAAAMTIVDELPRLQREVYAAFEANGPMSAKQAESLPEFVDYGFSTVRKRISELKQRGRLCETGQRDRGCAIFAVASSASTAAA